MLGKWIDGLTDAQRDRIVQGQGWRAYGSRMCQPDGDRCLLQHVDWAGYWAGLGMTHRGVWMRFDRLVRRFGLDRVVRACKMRAAATTSSTVTAPVEVRADV